MALDDFDVELHPRKRFRYASPAQPVSVQPTSAPSKLQTRDVKPQHEPSPLHKSKQLNSAGAAGPSASTSRTIGASERDVKGKGKAVAPLNAADDTSSANFKRRFAGPSTGKAGLLRDPQEVEQIIYEASVGSKYFENEQRKAKETETQVQRIVQRLEKAVSERKGNLSSEEAIAEKLAADLEVERSFDQTIVVVDADAFYASVEELDDPSLKGKAFGVGSGVLTTASYEARKYGVRSAMAGFVAKKLCPHLIFVKAHFNRYSECSKKIMEILREYDPNMSPASLDEAYMNITAHLQKTGQTPAEAVAEMRARVKTETGLTVSAGVAANKLLAKIAADINKPDGQCVVPPTREDAMNFMRAMPIRKVPGVGRVTEHWLTAVNIKTVGDVWPQRGKLLLSSSNEGTGTLTFLLKAYLGIGGTKVEPAQRGDRKSVGREDTFGDMTKTADLTDKIREIADTLGEDMERLEYSGRTVTLKLKMNTYEPITRAYTAGPNAYWSKADDFFRIGKQLLEKEISDRHAMFDGGKKPPGCHGKRDMTLRLLGLRVTNLRDERKEAEKRAAKGSIHGWAQQNGAASSHKSKSKSASSHPIDLDADPDDDADDLEHALRDDSPSLEASQSKSKAADIDGAECPVCSRRWSTRISQDMLEAHVEDCIARASRQASPPRAAKPPPPATKKKAKPAPKANDAFSLLMKRK